jgi:CubicO group peptidase (beta-lactamase class C family)
MMHMTARDFARFGEFLRRRGVAGGRQLVAESWMRFMTEPSPTNAAYGGQVWLNRPGEGTPLFPGEASPRLFAAAGFGGQYVIVSPAQQLVIVRLGVTRDEDMPALRGALAKLVQRFPN